MLQVARIQLQVQSALVLLRPSLNGDKAVKAEKALDELNRELMDISKVTPSCCFLVLFLCCLLSVLGVSYCCCGPVSARSPVNIS